MKFVVISIIIAISIAGVFAVSNYDLPITVPNQSTNMMFDKDSSTFKLICGKYSGGEIRHTITNVETTKYLTFGHSEFNGKMLENGQWLVVTMDIENLGKSKMYTFGTMYKVTDSKGEEFPSMTSDGNLEGFPPYDPYYNFELIPGMLETGKIAMQIPEDNSETYTLTIEQCKKKSNYSIHEIGNISFDN